jgi:glycosyltransferase involved in cell wall biosynthesis
MVTVIVACRDDADHVGECLSSIEFQDLDQFECLMVDDRSTDGSRAILDDFAAKDRRFRVVSHEAPLGLAATRNSGLARARGPFTTFLDGQDFLFQGSLTRRLTPTTLHTPEVAGTCGDWEIVSVDALPTSDPTNRRQSGQQHRNVDYFSADGQIPFISGAPLIRTDVARCIGGFNESVRAAEDDEFWMRLLRHGYSLERVEHVGVGSRQRNAGGVQPALTISAVESIDHYLDSPLHSSHRAPVDTVVLDEQISVYRKDLLVTKRYLVFMGLALLAMTKKGFKRSATDCQPRWTCFRSISPRSMWPPVSLPPDSRGAPARNQAQRPPRS